MGLLILLLSLTSCFLCGYCTEIGDLTDVPMNLTYPTINSPDSSTNMTDPAKDMYVIHATVYQVGILTNITDNMTDNFNSTGNQESVTLYHTNGTNIDLSSIPKPFLTNVTAQTLVGVAPFPDYNETNVFGNTLGALSQLTHPKVSADEKLIQRTKKSVKNYSDSILRLFKRDTSASAPSTVRVVNGAALIPPEASILRLFKRDTSASAPSTVRVVNGADLIPPEASILRLFKRDTSASAPCTVRVVNGAALIPPEASIQSISLPPLLSLNNNLTEFPVPIPNTSVVHYAKVNTLIQKP